MQGHDQPSSLPDATDGTGARPAGPFRVVVVDDHASVRRGVIGLLDACPDLELVGEAADGESAVALVRRLNPDVVLLDVSMPGMDGPAAAWSMARLDAPPAVVLFTAWADRARLADAMAAGAAGFILKDDDPVKLVSALTVAAVRHRRGAEVGLGARREPLGGLASGPGRKPAARPVARRRWPARIASGAAACVVLASAGAAAAAQGVLPRPMENAVRAVGLPTPPSDLEQAQRALTRLGTALGDRDRDAVSAGADELARRVAALRGDDLARVEPASSTALAAARAFLQQAQPEGGETNGAHEPATAASDDKGSPSPTGSRPEDGGGVSPTGEQGASRSPDGGTTTSGDHGDGTSSATSGGTSGDGRDSPGLSTPGGATSDGGSSDGSVAPTPTSPPTTVAQPSGGDSGSGSGTSSDGGGSGSTSSDGGTTSASGTTSGGSPDGGAPDGGS